MATQPPYSRWVQLSGSDQAPPPGAVPAPAVAAGEPIEVTLRLRRAAPLDADRARQAGPQKPVTRAQFAAEHGAAAGDVAAVQAFASHFKLRVLDVRAGQRAIVLGGTAAQMARAFSVELRRYALPDGSSFRGPAGAISIPAELLGIVESVLGLDDRPAARRPAPLVVRAAAAAPAARRAAAPRGKKPGAGRGKQQTPGRASKVASTKAKPAAAKPGKGTTARTGSRAAAARAKSAKVSQGGKATKAASPRASTSRARRAAGPQRKTATPVKGRIKPGKPAAAGQAKRPAALPSKKVTPPRSKAAASGGRGARRGGVPVPRDARAEARHILTFDSDDPSTFSPFTIPEARAARSTELAAIPWPAGMQPTPAPLSSPPSPDDPLPQCDYLVVTWTVEEAKALADVLTPGFPSKTAWYPYTHNFTSKFVPIIRRGAPSVADSHRLASYLPVTIDGKRVLCVKSELHMSQDGPKLPIALLWQQMIAETQAKTVITTGTAGGIGAAVELGDVVVAPQVRFDCQDQFKSAPFHNSQYNCSSLSFATLSQVPPLVAANLARLPKASRPPAVFTAPTAGVPIDDVVTTDFFAFDDASNTYKLQGLGAAVEMGDAVLGMVISQMSAKSQPRWTAIRNASDPQIADAGMTPAEARKVAAQIYERYGYWTTVPSAITCWAVILGN
jgi:nucleoside phosphorylase